MTTPTEVPTAVKKAFFAGAVAVGITAAVGNFGHVYEAGRYAKQGERMATVDAVLPDVLLVLCLLKLKYDRTSVWAWAGLVAAVGFIAWASIVTASGVAPGTAGAVTAKAVALWPLLVAIIAAGLIEAKHADPGASTKKSGEKLGSKAHPGTKTPTSVAASNRTSNPTGSAAPKTPAASPAPAAAGPKVGPETPPAPGRPLHLAGPSDQPADELLPIAQAVAQQLAGAEQRVNRDNLVAGIRAAGHTCSNQRGSDLLKQIKDGAA